MSGSGLKERVRLGYSQLAAERGYPLFHVERITPISTARDGRNYFRVEAALEGPIAALRPGMEGVAKIDAGRRRRVWSRRQCHAQQPPHEDPFVSYSACNHRTNSSIPNISRCDGKT